MNQLQNVFNYEGRQVRTVIGNDGEPWFVAKDICEVFGDTNYRRSVNRLDDDEKGVSPLNTPGGTQNISVVNEYGLYSLLFQMQPQKKASMTVEHYTSRVESLRKFKRWVTHDVLPTIRKTGRYEVAEKQPSYMIENGIERAERWIEEERERQQLAEQVAIAAPKAEAFDTFLTAENALSVGEVAKVLQCPGVGPRNIFDFLRKERFLIAPGRMPYQEHIETGLFRVVNTTYQRDGETLMSMKTVVTAKGIEKIRQRLVERGMYERKQKSA